MFQNPVAQHRNPEDATSAAATVIQLTSNDLASNMTRMHAAASLWDALAELPELAEQAELPEVAELAQLPELHELPELAELADLAQSQTAK